jgi:hypothetical protein
VNIHFHIPLLQTHLPWQHAADGCDTVLVYPPNHLPQQPSQMQRLRIESIRFLSGHALYNRIDCGLPWHRIPCK